MVMIMKLENIKVIDYIKKPQRDSTPKLHKLFNQDSAPFPLPTAKELIIEKLTWFKWFDTKYPDISISFTEDEESQELCNLIGIDWDDLDISIIDKHFAKKQESFHNQQVMDRKLHFKDFKLKS